jgi:hypothetical protein
MQIIRVRIDAGKATQEFKDARRDIRKKTREGLIEAGRRVVLPSVQQEAPSVVRDTLTVGSASTRAYITTRGPKTKDRIAGLLQYGGIVREPIRPKQEGGALSFIGTRQFSGQRIITGEVTGPRRYFGPYRGYVDRGIAKAIPEWERVMLPTVMDAFDGLEHTP